jgi:glutaconate CoA-transferase subunit B
VTFTSDEMMAVAASRRLTNDNVCFVGIGLPSLAANLARRTHAPECVLVYESGTIGAKPQKLPLSIGDGELAETADAVVSVPEMFSYWLQAGRIDVGFLVFVMLRQTPRAFVERLDFKTSRGDRVRVVVTDLGILEPRDGELTLVAVHPGSSVEQARAATGWDLRVADEMRETVPPTDDELTALRALETKGRS